MNTLPRPEGAAGLARVSAWEVKEVSAELRRGREEAAPTAARPARPSMAVDCHGEQRARRGDRKTWEVKEGKVAGTQASRPLSQPLSLWQGRSGGGSNGGDALCMVATSRARVVR